MARLRFDCTALAAALVLAGCGGGGGSGGTGGSGGSGGPVTSAPAPAPAPAPGPTPTPAPVPSPAPAPSPQVMRGAALYRDHCSRCHGDEPENGTQGVYKGLTADVLEAAYRRVVVMRPFTTLFTTTDTEDVAAFIESRVRQN